MKIPWIELSQKGTLFRILALRSVTSSNIQYYVFFIIIGCKTIVPQMKENNCSIDEGQ